jgi:hypothetical protein
MTDDERIEKLARAMFDNAGGIDRASTSTKWWVANHPVEFVAPPCAHCSRRPTRQPTDTRASC